MGWIFFQALPCLARNAFPGMEWASAFFPGMELASAFFPGMELASAVMMASAPFWAEVLGCWAWASVGLVWGRPFSASRSG